MPSKSASPDGAVARIQAEVWASISVGVGPVLPRELLGPPSSSTTSSALV